jgi:thioredoxin reductase
LFADRPTLDEGDDADVIIVAIGGQAGSSSTIRNYLGFARGVGGAELTRRAYEQAWAFGSRFLVGIEVTSMECGYDVHLDATTAIFKSRVGSRYRIPSPTMDSRS